MLIISFVCSSDIKITSGRCDGIGKYGVRTYQRFNDGTQGIES